MPLLRDLLKGIDPDLTCLFHAALALLIVLMIPHSVAERKKPV